MHKSLRTILILIISCCMLCSCTAGANKTHTQRLTPNIEDVPEFIETASFDYNSKEAGAFSPDGMLLATNYKNKIVVQRVRDGKKLFEIDDAFKEINDLSFSPKSDQLIYTYYHKKRKLHFYQIVNVASGKVLHNSTAVRGILSVPEMSPDGTRLAFTRSNVTKSTFYLKTISTNKIVGAINLHFQKSPFVKFTSDNSKLVLVSSKDILIVDAQSGKVTSKWESPFSGKLESINFALSHDNNKLIARYNTVDATRQFLTSFDLATGKHQSVKLPSQKDPFEKLIVSSDGTIFLAWNLCKEIQEYSVDSLELQRAWKHLGDFSQVMHVGDQNILIGTKKYMRTPDALFASATALIAEEQFVEAESLLQLMTSHYGESARYQQLVPDTLSCVESLILDEKEKSAQKAMALIGRYFPEAIERVAPSEHLIAAAEGQLKKGQYESASRVFASIEEIYKVATVVKTDVAIPEGRTVTVKLGTARAKKHYKNLTASIEAYVKKKEKTYVTLKEYSIPSPVKTPQVPTALKITQNKFETDDAFAHRVAQAKKSREAQIQQLMEEYRQKVSSYNNAVAYLERLKQKRIAELPARRPALIAHALKNTMQGVHVEQPYFDRQNGLLSFDLVGNGAPYRTRIGTSVQDAQLAELLFKAPKNASWNAEFVTSSEGFVLGNVECSIANTALVFKRIDSTYQSENNVPASVFISSSTPDELGKLIAVQKQTSEFADYQSDVTLLYSDGRTVKTTASAELDLEIEQLSYAPAQPQNYLLAIGIESYKSAPNVPFAENSLKLVTNLLGKKFGIPKENQIILPSTEATGQAIQGNMRNIAARLSPTDRLFFYYAGHGLASRNGKDVYMLPSDAVRGAYEDKDFSFSNMIKKYFSKVGRAYVFLDTCFSGRASAQTMLTKGIAPVYKTSRYSLPSNVTVFFAGQGDQYANFYPQKGHRLFSYYVIRSVLDGKTELKEMVSYLQNKVRSVSAQMGADHLQEPFIAGKQTGSLGQ